MKCRECEAAVKGFFGCRPDDYVCIGVKEPFIISDINVECTQYPENRKQTTKRAIKALELDGEKYLPYIGDDGIYSPVVFANAVYYQRIITKELFVEAYNKWIKKEPEIRFVGEDDADYWCE